MLTLCSLCAHSVLAQPTDSPIQLVSWCCRARVHVVALGGFAYLNSAKKVLRINAVSLAHQEHGLLLVAHPVSEKESSRVMVSGNR